MKQEKQTTSNDFWFKALTFIIIIGLMGLMALWRFYPYPLPDSSTTSIPPENSQPAWKPLQPSEIETTTIPKVDETAPITSVPGVGVNPITTPVTDSATPQPLTELKPLAVTPTLVQPVEVKPKSVQIYFKDRVWIKVTDSKGKLFEGIKNKGNELTVEGIPPFNFLVGSSSNVDLEYQGERLNLSSYPKHKKQRNTYVVGSEE
jgi:cytoskeleton protein RodZ